MNHLQSERKQSCMLASKYAVRRAELFMQPSGGKSHT